MTPSNDLVIRLATVADATAYYDHVVRHCDESGVDGDPIFHAFENGYSRDRITFTDKIMKEFETPITEPGWSRVWLVLDGETVVGTVLVRSLNQKAARHRCSLGIGIERPYRGGLGRQLMNLAIEWAKKQPTLEWMDLNVFANNQKAIGLYQSLGFKKTGEVPDFYRLHGQKITEMHMTMCLRA